MTKPLKSLIIFTIISKILSTPSTDAIKAVQKWHKARTGKNFTQEQNTNLIEIVDHYLLIDTQPTYQMERLWYIIATAYHEAGLTTIQEYREKKIGSYIWDVQNRYWFTGYMGRGLSQVTWKERYKRFSRYIGYDFLGDKLAVQVPKYSAMILNIGLFKGLFTGRGIREFVNDEVCDYVKARLCVNGEDQAVRIAGYAYAMLQASGNDTRACVHNSSREMDYLIE